MFFSKRSSKITAALALSLSLSLSSSLAMAWGDIGHGAIGYIAEKYLTPAARAMVYQLVGSEPLPVSAVFPDQVRSDDRFRPFSDYHFLEIPQGYTFDTLPDTLRADKDAHTIIFQAPAMLMRRDISPQQKLILYRYLIHMVGDIHQPLHVGNGVDMGANLCKVKWLNPNTNILETMNLHSVWDESLIMNIGNLFQQANLKPDGTKPWFGYRELGDIVLNEAGPVNIAKIQSSFSMDYGKWYDATRALHAVVYPDATPVKNPQDRAYCKYVDSKNQVVNGNFDASKIPTLSPDYVTKSLPVIKQQILLGGIRLAGILNKLAEGFKPPAGWTDASAGLELGKIILHNQPQKTLRLPQSKGKSKKAEPVQWRPQLPYPEND